MEFKSRYDNERNLLIWYPELSKIADKVGLNAAYLFIAVNAKNSGLQGNLHKNIMKKLNIPRTTYYRHVKKLRSVGLIK